MPICKGCGSSYDGSFKFCPHCGRAKPEPEELKIKVQVEALGYEEAILEVEWLRKTKITEPSFDYKPNLIDIALFNHERTFLLGDKKKYWQEISFFQFLLKSIHPKKGEYDAFKSDEFRAFYIPNDDIKIPSVVGNSLYISENGQKWVKDIFHERLHAWKQLNTFLISNGWNGITNKAINRIPPLYMEMDKEWFAKKKHADNRNFLLNQVGYLIVGIGQPDHTERMFRKNSVEGMKNKYRYQRQIT
jgi:hypothetical protein